MASSPTIYRSSTTAPVNIAVVKYWGKRDTVLNLPTNSSLSVTLSQSDLRAHTTASCSESYSPEPDSLVLNGQPEDIQASKRTLACLFSLRSLRAKLESADSSLPKLSSYPLRIASKNNFPTAAGLASSAAGFAALVRAIADLYELPHTPEQLSLIARQGSGSACRSLMGGYVAWRAGIQEDGSDSMAQEVAPASHWPEMRALILVVSAEKKSISSTAGMQVTVKTSDLFKSRVEQTVPKHMTLMEQAIQERDFQLFAEVTMRDSNSFHAVCRDSWPPIDYLNDVSLAACRVVEAMNGDGKYHCAYTFDAGPNPVIYYLESAAAKVEGTLRALLHHVEGWPPSHTGFAQPLAESGKELTKAERTLAAGISRVICTRVGGAPERTSEHLL
jgi:diphosphomevalonate decarboxylase